jgi:hypothetical protein
MWRQYLHVRVCLAEAARPWESAFVWVCLTIYLFSFLSMLRLAQASLPWTAMHETILSVRGRHISVVLGECGA